MARVFYPVEIYSAAQSKYQLLPFRFLRLEDGNEILVNEAGEFVLGPNGTKKSPLKKELLHGSDLYATFKSKHFITDDSSSPLLDLLTTKYWTKYSFIDGFTKLHIFVVTLLSITLATTVRCRARRQTNSVMTWVSEKWQRNQWT